MSQVANSVGLGAGLAFHFLLGRFGFRENVAGFQFRFTANLGGQHGALALIVGHLPSAFAANAGENGVAHFRRMTRPPQPNVHNVNAVHFARQNIEAAGMMRALANIPEQPVAKSFHPGMGFFGRDNAHQIVHFHVANLGADAAGDLRPKNFLSAFRSAQRSNELSHPVGAANPPADIGVHRDSFVDGFAFVVASQ